jgi:hypothetical protein
LHCGQLWLHSNDRHVVVMAPEKEELSSTQQQACCTWGSAHLLDCCCHAYHAGVQDRAPVWWCAVAALPSAAVGLVLPQG